MDLATFYKFFFKREPASPEWRQAAKDAGFTDDQIDTGLTEHDKTTILDVVQTPHEQELQVKDYDAAALKAQQIEEQRIRDAEAQAVIEAEAKRQQEDYLKLDTAAQEQATIAQVDREMSLQSRDEQAALLNYEARNQAIQTSVAPQTAYVSPVINSSTVVVTDTQVPSTYDIYEAKNGAVQTAPIVQPSPTLVAEATISEREPRE